MEFSTTYQTAFNRLNKIENAYQAGVQTYIFLKKIILLQILINVKLKT
jgi:hypothetical protein